MAGKKDCIGDPTKPRLSLIPKRALWEMGKSLTHGASHYGEYNFREGLPVMTTLDAALRHIFEFIEGEDVDQKSKCHHLGNALASLAMTLDTLEHNPHLDNRHKNEFNRVTGDKQCPQK